MCSVGLLALAVAAMLGGLVIACCETESSPAHSIIPYCFGDTVPFSMQCTTTPTTINGIGDDIPPGERCGSIGVSDDIQPDERCGSAIKSAGSPCLVAPTVSEPAGGRSVHTHRWLTHTR
eukprot:COSAG04_NODE_2172_length_4633_cov_2.631451_4_plen_119_part_01